MSQFKLRSDTKNLADENSSTDQLSKRKELRQANSTQLDTCKNQQAEIDRLRLALLHAIEENDQLRGQMAEVEALYAEAAQQNEQLTVANIRLRQQLKLAREEPISRKTSIDEEDVRFKSA